MNSLSCGREISSIVSQVFESAVLPLCNTCLSSLADGASVVTVVLFPADKNSQMMSNFRNITAYEGLQTLSFATLAQTKYKNETLKNELTC